MEALTTIGTTYGGALFDAARDLGKTDDIAEELTALADVFGAEPAFFQMVCSPDTDAASRKGVLRGVFESRIAPELLHFLYILVDKRRIAQFPEIVKAYHKKMNENLGISTGVVYSATPITAGRLTRIEAETGKLLQKNVKLKNLTDPELVGGFRVLIEGKLIDASIRRRLDDLRDQLTV